VVVIGDSFVESVGLALVFGREIRFPIKDMDLAPSCEALCYTLADYCRDSGRAFSAGETVAWASSVLRFDALDAEILCAAALDLEADVFRNELDDLLESWQQQQNICRQNSSLYVQTAIASMAVVSPDVLEGVRIREAVRYPFAGENCGWWFLGESFSGDFANMKVAHVGHVLRSDRRIRSYLGLEPGFAVQPSDGKIWFEAEAAARGPI